MQLNQFHYIYQSLWCHGVNRLFWEISDEFIDQCCALVFYFCHTSDKDFFYHCHYHVSSVTDACIFFVLISMEEQVISRAHRMGATRPIHVETLAMRGTVEEQMLKLLQVCVHDMLMTF